MTKTLRALLILLFLAFTGTAFAQETSDWMNPFPPYRIIANIYYVGSQGLASYLITTPEGHIVINSGFTFREAHYLTNSQQTPKLPDWAVVDITTPPDSYWPGKIVDARFFGEHWEWK